MHASLRAIAFGFAVLSTGTRAANTVSLSSFTPRINNINDSQCQAVYTKIIEGCTPNDFVPNTRCSSECVKGLFAIGEQVKSECSNVDVGETSIIGVFQNDLGIRALCPGNSLGGSTPSTTSSTRTSTQTSTRATSAAPPASTLTTSTSTLTSTSRSQSQAAQSSSTSSQVLVTDPNPTSIAGGSPTNVAPPPSSSIVGARPTQPPNAQLSNADSGGGSPFDVQATSDSSQLRVLGLMMAALGTTVLFVACA